MAIFISMMGFPLYQKAFRICNYLQIVNYLKNWAMDVVPLVALYDKHGFARSAHFYYVITYTKIISIKVNYFYFHPK